VLAGPRRSAPRRGPASGPRALAVLLAGLALGAGLGGCGGAPATPAALRLEREDLITVARALQGMRGEVRAEVAATRAAWPLLANGLPAGRALAGAGGPIRAAAAAAAALRVPAVFQEDEAGALTGPAATLDGLIHTFSTLSTRGWQMIEGALAQIEHGPPVAARFARANVALYIESVYDAHFSLAQLGKQLLAGYDKLGGPAAFGAALTRDEVEDLARAYSEASDRLHPHVGVRLGS